MNLNPHEASPSSVFCQSRLGAIIEVLELDSRRPARGTSVVDRISRTTASGARSPIYIYQQTWKLTLTCILSYECQLTCCENRSHPDEKLSEFRCQRQQKSRRFKTAQGLLGTVDQHPFRRAKPTSSGPCAAEGHHVVSHASLTTSGQKQQALSTLKTMVEMKNPSGELRHKHP
jgi:hypothetical protein